MRNKVAKYFRKMAKAEMAQDRAPDRDLVEHPNRSSVINAPKSVRAMYLKLKAAYKSLRSSGTPSKQIVARQRKCSGFAHPLTNARPALIQSPLKQLNKLALDNESHRSVYLEAQDAANRGDGATVRRLAQAYV